MACNLQKQHCSLSSRLNSKVSLIMVIHSNDDWTNQLINKPIDHSQGSHSWNTFNANLKFGLVTLSDTFESMWCQPTRTKGTAQSAQEENVESTGHCMWTTELWLTWQCATDSAHDDITSVKMLLTSQQVSFFLMIHSSDDWTNHLMNHKAVISATPSMEHIWIDMVSANNKKQSFFEQWHTTTACKKASCVLMHSLQDSNGMQWFWCLLSTTFMRNSARWGKSFSCSQNQSTMQEEAHLMLLCTLAGFRVRNGAHAFCWAIFSSSKHALVGWRGNILPCPEWCLHPHRCQGASSHLRWCIKLFSVPDAHSCW